MSVFVAGGLKRHRSLFLFLWFLLSIPHQSFKVMCVHVCIYIRQLGHMKTPKAIGEEYIFLMNLLFIYFWLIAFHQFFVTSKNCYLANNSFCSFVLSKRESVWLL